MTQGQLPAPFAGGGGEGARLAAIDWDAHPLGPVSSWPQSLRTALSIVLRSQFPMFVFWGEDLVQLYNDAYVPIPGAKHPDSQGAPARDTWAEIWDDIGPLVDTVVNEGKATWSEDQLLIMERHGFPEETYFTFSYSPVEDESGGVGGVFCACTETTARVLSERRIRTVRALSEGTAGSRSVDEAIARALAVLQQHRLDLPVIALYVTDADSGESRLAGTVGVERGSPPAPLHVAADLPADDPRRPIADAALSLTTTHVTDLSEVIDHLDGGPWEDPPREAVVRPLSDPTSGTAAGVLIAGISPRHRYDEAFEAFVELIGDTLGSALADANARDRERQRLEGLAELNQAKTEFFSNVSHEFRTPLTLMLGPIEDALVSGTGLEGDRLTQVQRNAQRLLKLVNTLLEFSRVEAGQQQGRFRPVELGSYTEEIAAAFRSTIEDAGLRYLVGCETLPRKVHVDPDLWEKIVLNLVSNAFKFTDQGSVDVLVRDDGDHALIEVRDTGTGISREHQRRLFERFYRVDGAEGRTHEGSGIGLALVKELVELHGGRIEVESEAGSGSCFRIKLPYGTGHLPEGSWATDDASVRSPGGREADRRSFVAESTGWLDDAPVHLSDDERPTILVVDDNADMRRYLTEVLGGEWNVRTAADGQAALDTIAEDRPDLVVTDLMMPVRDGFELLSALRAGTDTADIPIVVLSARAGEEASGEALEAGADDYVTKPFTSHQLVARVRANLRMAALRGQLAAARGRTELLSGVSHDMQTPLALILGVLSELRAEVDDNGQLELIEIARARAEHLKLLVQQFLDHAHLEAGKDVRLELATVDVVRCAQDAAALFGNSRVVVEDHGRAPAQVDGTRVRQILANLIHNALTYTDAVVTVGVKAHDGVVRAWVSDEGPGVPEDELDSIFHRFERGTTARDRVGSGLGLFVSRALAERMRASLYAVREGGGTRFVLDLPPA